MGVQSPSTHATLRMDVFTKGPFEQDSGSKFIHSQ